MDEVDRSSQIVKSFKQPLENHFRELSSFTQESFDSLLNTHFKGTYFLTQKALPLLNDGGRIINTSSGLARFSIPGYKCLCCHERSHRIFYRYLTKELGGRGITANIIAPGAIETDFTAPAFNANPQMRDIIKAQTALGRTGLTDDIGGMAAFLCTDQARWINAQRIEASEGMFI